MRAILIIACAALLGGCTYTVRVRNDNGQPITMRLVQTDPLMKDWTLAERKVNPGETVQLGPARTSAVYVLLEADPTHGDGLGLVRRAVLPGDHAFRVGLEEHDDHTRIMVRSAGWRELEP